MGRILAIDYGKKRTGLAVTDSLQIIAGGLCTVDSTKVIPYLKDYCSRERVERIVVGYARQMNAEDSESMQWIHPFVEKLKKEVIDIEIVFHDERFTSKLAHKAMLDGGLRKKERQNKALVDEISATILLQDFLESKRMSQGL